MIKNKIKVFIKILAIYIIITFAFSFTTSSPLPSDDNKSINGAINGNHIVYVAGNGILNSPFGLGNSIFEYDIESDKMNRIKTFVNPYMSANVVKYGKNKVIYNRWYGEGEAKELCEYPGGKILNAKFLGWESKNNITREDGIYYFGIDDKENSLIITHQEYAGKVEKKYLLRQSKNRIEYLDLVSSFGESVVFRVRYGMPRDKEVEVYYRYNLKSENIIKIPNKFASMFFIDIDGKDYCINAGVSGMEGKCYSKDMAVYRFENNVVRLVSKLPIKEPIDEEKDFCYEDGAMLEENSYFMTYKNGYLYCSTNGISVCKVDIKKGMADLLIEGKEVKKYLDSKEWNTYRVLYCDKYIVINLDDSETNDSDDIKQKLLIYDYDGKFLRETDL